MTILVYAGSYRDLITVSLRASFEIIKSVKLLHWSLG